MDNGREHIAHGFAARCGVGYRPKKRRNPSGRQRHRRFQNQLVQRDLRLPLAAWQIYQCGGRSLALDQARGRRLGYRFMPIGRADFCKQIGKVLVHSAFADTQRLADLC